MRLLPALILLPLAACGPSKGGDETGETSAADTTAAITTGTTASPTTTTPPPGTTTGTTADNDCIDPPECEPCAPGCQQGSCVDGQWVCDCVPCGGTDPDTTTTMTSEPGTTDVMTTAPTTMTSSPSLDLGGVEVDCLADPPVFPSFKGAPCMDNNECSLGTHQLDCCGSLQAIGFALGDFDAFDAAEDKCRAQYPRCDCAAQPTIDDDGNTSPTDFFLGLCVDNICKAVAQ
jgi:hypothetical protein